MKKKNQNHKGRDKILLTETAKKKEITPQHARNIAYLTDVNKDMVVFGHRKKS